MRVGGGIEARVKANNYSVKKKDSRKEYIVGSVSMVDRRGKRNQGKSWAKLNVRRRGG